MVHPVAVEERGPMSTSLTRSPGKPVNRLKCHVIRRLGPKLGKVSEDQDLGQSPLLVLLA